MHFIDKELEKITTLHKASYLYKHDMTWKSYDISQLRKWADYYYNRIVQTADIIRKSVNKNLKITVPIQDRPELHKYINRFNGLILMHRKYIDKLNRFELIGEKKGHPLYRWHPDYDKRKRARYQGLDL